MRRSGRRFRRGRKCSELLNRAEADPVCLPERAIDSTRFGDAHLGSLDSGGNIGRISIAVTHKAPRTAAFVDDSFEHPATRADIGEFVLEHGSDSAATSAGGKLQ